MSELTKIAASQTPYRRRSKLDPHLADLRRLQNDGFSLAQLRAFLMEIGVSVSRQSIYDFLKRRESVTLMTEKNIQEQQDKNKSPASPDCLDEGEQGATSTAQPGEKSSIQEVQQGEDGIVDVFAKQAEREAKKAAEAKRPKIPRR